MSLGDGFHGFRGIAFVGNYLPRKCGIATFTHDLAEAVAIQAGLAQPVSVCAMNDIPEGYDYPDRVKFEVRQDSPMDYTRAADFLNFSRVDAVSLQHEYGIFGGEAGANVLALLRALRWPLVVTCHTVLKDPLPSQKEVFVEIAARARKIVVMSAKAFSFLEEIYGVAREKIVHIPHGIHDVPFIDPSYFKDKFGVEGKKVLLTFGLLSRNKGIEQVIEALPAIIKKHPKVIYMVLGATHPGVIREEGESYRLSLQRLVRELSLENHVSFHPRFVELDALLEYLGATDIFVTPYHNMDQITSGALSYAMGTGKAVVSTPYWHAEELLAEGRGRLVSPLDVKGLAREIISLLDNEVTLTAVRKKAYLYCRKMIWPTVARNYLDLFDEVRSHAAKTFPVTVEVGHPITAMNVPLPKLDHVARLSDDTSIAHHARRALPNWSFGYWLEDAAAALVVTAKFFDTLGIEQAQHLAETYLRFLQYLVEAQDEIVGSLSYRREFQTPATETDLGKTIWALGYAVSHGPTIPSDSANDTFNRLVPEKTISESRGAAYAVLGAANYLARFPGASLVRKYLATHAARLFEATAPSGWLDAWPADDWGVALQALAIAGGMLDSPKLRRRSIELAYQLIETTHHGSVFLKRNENPDEEELPVSAMSFIEALGAVFQTERDRTLLGPIRAAADWFLGANRRNESLYDFNSGGCCDALTASGLNQNQGPEATISCLLSFLTLYEIANINVDERITTNQPLA